MKEYTFEEKALLGLYLSEITFREAFKKPFSIGGFVYATDEYKIIRLKKDILKEEYPPYTKPMFKWPERNCDRPVTLSSLQEVWDRMPTVEETIIQGECKDCPECNGEGEVEWEYTDSFGKAYCQDFDCPVCGGSGYAEQPEETKTGRMIPDLEASIGFGFHNLRADHVLTLMKTMTLLGKEEIRLTYQNPNTDKMTMFDIDKNISVIIMANLRPAFKHISLKDFSNGQQAVL